ncbi:MAG: capsular biosynthesis protein [Bacteroidetes bacterium]|nr:capsular biosynthesis protein [Bacteroidota bacterium]MBP6401427.1 capsular biosynthesis protein [Bacteroidia bacterium]MBK9523304.1 capsular biosynthesis protein [Bacteroidota bacterium]MBK9541047.1 capsular biosynthesis protein [Bacteroidota bacterium]MBL0259072.1 capsular biosynthesis protein [Bacteroidota bacterium]
MLTDLSVIVTDIHSHLIPGIDDGVKDLDESLAMIRGFSALGYQKLVTTPHIMSDFYKNTPEIILGGLERVQEAIQKAGIPITIDAAAEYYLDEVLLKKIQTEKLLTIGGKYLLFEISYVNPPDNLYNVIFEMNVKGYKPILAHPERYPFYYTKFEEYYRIKEAGALFQLNTNSLVGYYGAGAKKIAERMVDEKMIDFIGSDLHGERHLDALQKTVKEKYLAKLISQGVLNTSL